MYARPPSAASMHALGLFAEDYEEEPAAVWPENWPVFGLFVDLQTQWRAGFGGLYGLDYGVVHRELDLRELQAPQRRQWMDDIRTLESAALDRMTADRDVS